MTNDTKEKIQYGSAVAMIASGVTLTFICFFSNGHEISDSVLWYVAQCLVYAGSVFGVTMYVTGRMNDISDNARKRKDDKA